jgi:hypothetical protein
MVTIAVLVANRAGDKVIFRLIERKAPCQRIGACFRLVMSILKTVPKQLLQGWMQYFKGRCTGLRAKGHLSPSTIGEVSRGDARLVGRWITAPLEKPIKRMCPFHQELEDYHRYPKEIMLWHTIDVSGALALKFRRRDLWRADGAAVHDAATRVADLKGIRIHQRYQCSVGDKNIGRLHISNDIAAGVKGMHCGGEITRGMMEAEIVKPWMLLAARPGVVDVGDRVHPAHARHQEANALTPSISRQQQVHGPGNGDTLPDGQRVIGWIGQHGHKLARAVAGRLVIDLGDQRRLLWDRIDARLTPGAEC